MTTTLDAGTRSADSASFRDWLGLAILALPCLLYSMDLTVLNMAVPHLVADLGPSATQLLWIVDIYGFVLAGMLITMGALGDRIGRRRLLMWGALAFGFASILAAFAPSVEVLILARALLGVAAATLAPSTLSLISNIFRVDAQRSLAIGVWMASFSLGGAIGPLVGGALLEHFWWGSVFLISVPVMLLLLAASPLVLPEYKDPEGGKIDLASAAMSVATILMLVYAIKHFVTGHIDVPALMTLSCGLIVGALFVRRQLRSSNPMVDLRLFQRMSFLVPVAVYFLGLFLAFGTLLLLAQYLQLVLGLSPFTAGLWTLFSAAGFVAGSLLAPIAARYWPSTGILPASLLLAAIGFVVIALGVTTPLFEGLLLGSFLMSLGIAPVLALSTDLIIGTAPPQRAGAAAAIAETASELGGALGIAVIGSIAIAVYRGALQEPLTGIGLSLRGAMLEGIGPAKDELGSAGPADTGGLELLVEQAFSTGFATVSVLAAALALIGAGLCLVMRRT